MTIRPLKLIAAAVMSLAFCIPAAASAQLSDDVRAMIDAAIATGDAEKVRTVIDLARQTQPEGLDDINALEKKWRGEQAEAKALAKVEKEEAIRQAGLFDLWSGEGQLGAFQSSGNTDNIGISAALKLKRQGLQWSHALRATADFQRTNGVTSREQYLFAYEPRYQIDNEVFAYGLAQLERDRRQGFSQRYAVSGGLGYRVANTDSLKLSIKAGPAFRVTSFVDGPTESRVAALFGADFDWQFADGLTLTQDTNMVAETGGEATLIIDSSNTSLNVITGLDAKISDRLRSRLSYAIEYDSNPPAGAVSTDTLTRFTLVYGF